MTYTRNDVERLLPAVWDEEFAWGMLDETAPDPTMPRGTVDPSHGHTLYAMLADIRTAWTGAHLTPQEKVALQMMGRYECTAREAGRAAGVSHVTMLQRWEDGIGRMTFWLNGDSFEYDQTQSDVSA